MSRYKHLKEMIVGATIAGTIFFGGLTGLQTLINKSFNKKEIQKDGYMVTKAEGIWPFSEKKTIEFRYGDLFERKIGMLAIYFTDDTALCLTDSNGDFELDHYSRTAPYGYEVKFNLSKEDAKKIWENYMRKLNVFDIHKEWLLKYGEKNE